MSLLEKLLYAGLGFSLGLIYSSFENTLLHRRNKETVHHIRWSWFTSDRSAHLRATLVWLAVLVTFVAAFIAGNASHKTSTMATDNKKVIGCTTGVLSDLLKAQNLRANANAKVLDASDALDLQFSMLLTVISDKTATKKEKLQAFNDYRSALDAKIAFSLKSKKTRENNPLPKSKEVVDCTQLEAK